MAEILQFLTSFCHGNMRKPLLRWIKIGHSMLNSVKLWTIWIEILGSGDLERQFEMGWNVSRDLALSQPFVAASAHWLHPTGVHRAPVGSKGHPQIL